MNKDFKSIIIVLLSSLLILSCTSKKNKIYTIGFSQCISDDLWRKQMINEMKIETSFYDNFNLIIEDAKGNSELQVKQIGYLLNQKVDLLIISPNESDPITPIAEKAYNEGTPTILIDRKINSDKYSVFIGADNYAIGKYAAIFLGNLKNKNYKILEVWGLNGSSPAQERHKGFIEQLKEYPNLTVSGRVFGKWTKQEAFNQVMKLENLDQYDIIFGHNDVMAIGAYNAFVNHKLNIKNKLFIGVDALMGPDGGIQYVIDKKLNATLMYPTGGGKAIQVAHDILSGRKVKKEYKLNTAIVDNSNAEILQLQSVQINDYKDKIEMQLKKITSLDNKFDNQQTLLYIVVIFMVITLFLAILLYLAYHHARRINTELQLKNEKIIQQREELSLHQDQLVIMNKKIEEVTSLKLRFFTNISHELRTPLSLLISPLEKIIEINRNPEIMRELVVMKNNVDILLRLITQLLDFRKIEDGQMNLSISKINIVAVIKNIKAVFNYQAYNKKINYVLDLNHMENIEMYIDVDKIEKVLLNILSNAFKFSRQGGIIKISLIDHNDEFQIIISDSGKGIDDEQKNQIFDLFYQGKDDYHSGTGVGLYLAREFIELHRGRIEVTSKTNEGSTFSVFLKKGNEHLQVPYISIVAESEVKLNQSEVNEIDNELFVNQGMLVFEKGEYNLLIIEDNDEMREYLKSRLQQNYNIFTVPNGIDALQILKDVDVNLIVCDVMMPEMDGFEFCNKIKNNLAYDHIPIILLTALTGEEHLLQGLAFGADDYIYKPFNLRHLELKIKNLLSLKKKVRDSFMQEYLGAPIDISYDSADKKFIKKVTFILDKYIRDNEISIEKISSEIGLSRVHLYRKVKELTGTSPSEFFKVYKIKRSLPLLKAKNLSISEISYNCGFSSPAYYSKCFKDVFHISPSEY